VHGICASVGVRHVAITNDQRQGCECGCKACGTLCSAVSLTLSLSLLELVCIFVHANMNVFRHFAWICSSEKRTRTHSLTRAQPCKCLGDFCCPVNAPSPIFLSYSFVVCGIPAVVAVIGLASGAKCDGRIMVTRGKQSKRAITQMQHTTPSHQHRRCFQGHCSDQAR